eukprot:GHVQ01023451.1.p1 GENE.GHVQ01023451.1~~GHVQ01023451.1.p1  ORF type:complete len:186 (-),score=18.16 GHVQ01023451.1:420-977(-)
MGEPAVNRVRQLVESNVLQALQETEAQIDEEIRQLDRCNEDDLENLRRKRIQEMKQRAAEEAQYENNGHGTYQELFNEKEFFEASKKSKFLVCLFYRPSNRHCLLVDSCITALVAKHMHIRFVKINAEKTDFLCQRLKIWMIPTILLVKEQRTDHSIVGLDEIGGDKASPAHLEKVLRSCGLLDT